jgi:hypothetical protein
MGAVTTVPALLDALVAALAPLPGLAGVNVFSGPIADPKEEGVEFIKLGTDEIEAEYTYRIGTPMQIATEEYEVPGVLLGVVSGTGETGIKAARDRAYALLGEVHDYLKANDTVGGAVRDARIVRHRAKQFIYDDKQRCTEIAFWIRVQAEFTPT